MADILGDAARLSSSRPVQQGRSHSRNAQLATRLSRPAGAATAHANKLIETSGCRPKNLALNLSLWSINLVRRSTALQSMVWTARSGVVNKAKL